MKNYRKAKHGDVPCRLCRYVIAPLPPTPYHRCGESGLCLPAYVVGKRNTCDNASARPEGEKV